jgi:small subunit ribosomal protein S1
VLKQAFANHATVEGKITGTNKGGFDVLISGFRAFCPISQIDRIYCSDPQSFVGKTMPFRIIEYKEGGRRIVISRRMLLEDDRKKQAEETRLRLQVGDEIDGVVVRLQPFGAFVDIGGIDGLVHVSELRHARVMDPAEVVQVGQPLRVKVIGIEKLGDEKNERISLSAKALEGDPWSGVGERLKVGDIVHGRVLRLMNYGAFVEVLPGVEGLLHVTELGGQKVRHPREAVSENETVEVRVLEFDPERKRLSLSRRLDPATDAPAPAAAPKLDVGMAVVGKVSNVKPYGVFVRIHEPVSGVDGLLPADETHLERGTDLAPAFPAGSTVQAEVLRIDERGRIRLTQRSAEERAAGRERDGARPRAEGGRGGEQGHDGPRGGRRDRERDRERERERDAAADPGGEGERRESKVAAGFGIMANAFKRVLDGRG